ncbi:alanyl-tRNA synthetase [Mycotypha africana]|uniref:alanyl-tRNA synthetase n=1 Tax=Mycotypha africana TaxID=64632 RepID=UPI002301502F|nr:alanyl-tRNA synthetase [Mycotypha africana]KAI8991542.1 alanyl-tRNA synthetase [Mycotypha africana]
MFVQSRSLFVRKWSTASNITVCQARFIKQLTSPELRSKFIQYFESLNHTPVKSSSLIPHNDKSLLFTNAGMVPFKEYFLKPADAPFKCATSIQKCMRAGGKHNDLDNVGFTPRHHTFFEMLGNFSFGKYSKAEAIRYAWKFLLEELELPVNRLRVTVLEGDTEAYDLWKQQGLSDDKIVSCGPEDNFWSMGDGEGPCGSCTEIFWDTQDASLDDPWLEIWNLVFMEKYRNAKGQLTELPTPCIDTGMGLERMISVLQGKQNNFQIDQFQTLIDGLRDVMAKRGIQSSINIDPSAHEKIIADHFRAMCFLIGDGVVPSNIGRGYVLRRIIRRALRSAKQLGIKEPFLTDLYPSLLSGFTDGSYPELQTRASSICTIINNEETAFLATLDRGMALLENVFNRPDLQDSKVIAPEIVFQLYDTYGFPFDLTFIIAKEKGWKVDINAVEKLREKQRMEGRETWKSDSIANKSRLSEWRKQNIRPQFTGYLRDALLQPQEAEILAFDAVQQPNNKKLEVNIAIDPCPFYGFGGGQVPDQGIIELGNGSQWKVVDVTQPYEGGIALRIEPVADTGKELDLRQRLEADKEFLQKRAVVRAKVETVRRENTEIHHTATHLLNAGLRKVLNTQDIVQAGSTVEPEKLRFDFTYGKPLKEEELKKIENWVNEAALKGAGTIVKHMKLKDAVDSGAIAAFTEKYGENVRVVEVPGISKELCGGTHVDNIRKLYPFKILNETSVAAGTRRIEAVAGLSCIKWYKKSYEPVPEALKLLRANGPHELIDKLQKVLQQTKDLQKRVEFMNEKLATEVGKEMKPVIGKVKGAHQNFTRTLKDIDVKVHLIDADLDVAFMQKRANVLKETQPETAHVLVNGKNIMVSVNSANVRTETANSIMKQLFKHIRGGGGGQKELAQGRLAETIATEKDVRTKLIPALSKC